LGELVLDLETTARNKEQSSQFPRRLEPTVEVSGMRY
jgi:hypothetical protein